ncbi:DUF1801 domain-containing protein [Sphingobacterium sp. LRF_L2]|uniref:DUF1801 domain-containing protein n=1 Tax=Sphingobacterium sp. LRF_L2 TaxID=3369421 RepID=UPI003F6414A7
MIHPETLQYNDKQTESDAMICRLLSRIISDYLPAAENKLWHAHPVWFLDDNPIVGYSKLKDSVRLMFWSGQSFEAPELLTEGKFKAAEIRYTDVKQVNEKQISEWLRKANDIQWDYKNLVKRKGVLERLK